MRLDVDPRLPQGADVPRLVTRLYEVLRAISNSANRHEDGFTAAGATCVIDYAAQAGDSVVFADATSAPLTVALQHPAQGKGKRVSVRKIDPTANAVTVTTPAGLINGGASVSLSLASPAVTLVSDGSNYFTL